MEKTVANVYACIGTQTSCDFSDPLGDLVPSERNEREREREREREKREKREGGPEQPPELLSWLSIVLQSERSPFDSWSVRAPVRPQSG